MRRHIHEFLGLRVGLVGLALMVLAGTGGPSARGATLRWKFKSGETLRYSMDQKSVVTVKYPGGQEMKSTLSQIIDMNWTVKSVESSGVADLTLTITRIRDQVEGTVGSYAYDSKDGKEPESLIAAAKIPVFKALLGVAVPFKMSPRGEPSDVRVPDTLLKKLGELGPSAAGAGALFSEEGLKEMISRASLILPEEDVAQGKTWTQQTKSASPVGTFILESKYTNEGPAADAGAGAVKIGLTVKAQMQPAEAGANGNSDPGANGLKIRSQKSQGTFTFDNTAGRVVGSSLGESIEIGASVKIGLGATAKELEIVQSSESTTIRKLIKE